MVASSTLHYQNLLELAPTIPVYIEGFSGMGDGQAIRWCIDLGMGITFLVTFITGLFKWTLFMRTLGLTDMVLPLALMSDIHDWAGFLLGVFVAIHLSMNRVWILTMTKKIITGRFSHENGQ